MNKETLWPVLVAMQLTAAALIAGTIGIGFENQESGHQSPPVQGVEWKPGSGCAIVIANADFIRSSAVAYRPLNAMGPDQHGCMIYR